MGSEGMLQLIILASLSLDAFASWVLIYIPLTRRQGLTELLVGVTQSKAISESGGPESPEI